MTNNNKIAYQKCGKGEVLVFIHAGGLDQEMWKDQTAHFKDSHQVITYDIRGHGQSAYVSNASHDIEDLKIILDNEAIENITLVGCSLGAILVIDYVLSYPEKVDRLVLVSPGLIGFQEYDSLFQLQMAEYVQNLVNADTAAMVDKLKKLNALGSKNQLNESVDAYVNKALASYVRSAGLLRIPQLANTEPISSIPAISLPSLVLYGGDDHAYIIKNAHKLAKLMLNANIYSIPGSAHLPGLEQPEIFNQILSEFLTQTKLP